MHTIGGLAAAFIVLFFALFPLTKVWVSGLAGLHLALWWTCLSPVAMNTQFK